MKPKITLCEDEIDDVRVTRGSIMDECTHEVEDGRRKGRPLHLSPEPWSSCMIWLSLPQNLHSPIGHVQVIQTPL